MAQRFINDYALPEYDAATLTQSLDMARYFELVARTSNNPKLTSNWVMGEISRRLNAAEIGIAAAPVSAQQLSSLICRIADDTISNSAARQVLDAYMVRQGSRCGCAN